MVSNTGVVSLKIRQHGETFDLLRPENSTDENEYGKIEEDQKIYTKRSKVRGILNYTASATENQLGTGGRAVTSTPSVYLRKSVDPQIGDRLVSDTEDYIIDSIERRSSHIKCKLSKYNE